MKGENGAAYRRALETCLFGE